jgi:hypothetical protein
MDNPITVNKNRRVHKRSAVLLSARYFPLNATYPKECVIIDVSRQGACVKLPADKSISKGSRIILEVFDKQSNNITIKGEVVWIRESAVVFVVGVKFQKLLDMNTINSLG